jgi:hypothetical protein
MKPGKVSRKGAKAQNYMNNESLEQIGRQLASMRALGSPAELRRAVLGDVARELRASRWDRRLARVAAVLIVLGVGMNAALGLQLGGTGGGHLSRERRAESRASLVDTAIVVGEATDARTAQQFARQFAAMTGRKLTADEVAAIDAAVERQTSHGTAGNRG